jgi:hypothetical protein
VREVDPATRVALPTPQRFRYDQGGRLTPLHLGSEEG